MATGSTNLVKPLFSFKLPSIATLELPPIIADFDGVSLVFKSAEEQIVIYSPAALNHRAHLQEIEVIDLHFDKILHLASGRLDPLINRDILVAVSQSTIVAYDVLERRQLFQRRLAEEPRCIAIIPDSFFSSSQDEQSPLVLVGGNCSVQGYDLKGSDDFWLSASDMVNYISLPSSVPLGETGVATIVCEDGNVFSWKSSNPAAMNSVAKFSQQVSRLLTIGNGSFVYATSASMGVWSNGRKLWSCPSKGDVVGIIYWNLESMVTFISNDGVVDSFNFENGSPLFSVKLGQKSKIVQGMSIMAGSRQIMALSLADGSILGYPQFDQDSAVVLLAQIEQLQEKKRKLQEEIDAKGIKSDCINSNMIPIPSDISLKTEIMASENDLLLIVSTSVPDFGSIKSVTMKSEKLFPTHHGLSAYVASESKDSKSITVPLHTDCDIKADLTVTAHVNPKGRGCHNLLLESTILLPVFTMYHQVKTIPVDPSSQCSFAVKTNISKILDWVQRSFLVPVEPVSCANNKGFELFLKSYRDQTLSIIRVAQIETICKVVISTDSIKFAASFIQDLVSDYLKINELDVSCSFPGTLNRLKEIISSLENIQQTKFKISGVISENCSTVKGFLLMAEEALLLEQPNEMKMAFTQLFDQNKSALLQNKIRYGQHEEYQSFINQINEIVQQSANLRIGSKDLLQKCRQLIIENRFSELVNAIKL